MHDRVRNTQTVNFVLTAESHAGVSILKTALERTGAVVLHIALFSQDAQANREAHEAYYGVAPSGKGGLLEEWYKEGETNPRRYLHGTVFDNPRRGESHIGVHLPYDLVDRHQLFDFLASLPPDRFPHLHLIRNPVACMLSARQARYAPDRPPPPVILPAADVIDRVRAHALTRTRLERHCPRRLDIEYRALLFRPLETMRRVAEYLGLQPARPLRPATSRRRNRPLPLRVFGYEKLLNVLPRDVREVVLAAEAA